MPQLGNRFFSYMGLSGRHRAPSAACYIQPVLPASLSNGLCTLRTSFSGKQSIVGCVITGLKNVQTAQNGKPRKKQQREVLSCHWWPFTWWLHSIPAGLIRVVLISCPMPASLHMCSSVLYFSRNFSS